MEGSGKTDSQVTLFSHVVSEIVNTLLDKADSLEIEASAKCSDRRRGAYLTDRGCMHVAIIRLMKAGVSREEGVTAFAEQWDEWANRKTRSGKS